MDMPSYLSEVHYATSTLLQALWGERDHLAKWQTKLDQLTQLVQNEYKRTEWIAMNAEDLDDIAMATGRYWENYFGPDRERYETKTAVEELQERIKAHEFSVQALAAAVLQYAKQGLSIVHGGIASAPPGRKIGTQALRDVIWQARNQALHWEEGKPHPPVERCFNTLATDFGALFTDYRIRNLAFQVVEVLGWRKWEDFEVDMMLLA